MNQSFKPSVDPIIEYQYLQFENRCLKASGDEFQRLFEDIMVRAQPGFMRIRPYGNIGDRKCDGLFQADSTLYQVYSPDELKQTTLQKKLMKTLLVLFKIGRTNYKSGFLFITLSVVCHQIFLKL